MIVRGGAAEQLSLEVAELGRPETSGDDDLLLGVRVIVGGYSAEDRCWVVGRAWQGFLEELRLLERTRRGHADLVGASPEELRIRFANTDASGHMSVAGTISWRAPGGFLQKLQFGFSFDPGMLGAIVLELGTFVR